MKLTRSLLATGSVVALAALIIGCATTTTTSTQDKETMLVAAGFKVVTPKTPEQQQKLKNLPVDHIAMIKKSGKTYYIYPDAADNQAYVGGPAEYKTYQQARTAASMSQEFLESATMHQDSMMRWETWGGWGAGWGQMGVGRF